MVYIIVAALSFAAASFYAAAEDDVTYHDSAEDAAAVLRDAMKDRKGKVSIGLTGKPDEDELKQAIGKLLDLATDHTGKPDEGDYINFQYASYKGTAHTDLDGLTPVIQIDYELEYYDSKSQEDEVDKAVDHILNELDIENKTDYERIAAIHDFICDSTEYEAAEDGDNIRRTAYGALIDGKAVCQGYSLALYRLLLEAGIDNRIIFGQGIEPAGASGSHTWNIVKLYGKYYYIDPTWDDSTFSRDYFLVPAGKGFEDQHIPDAGYPDDYFTEKYPVTKDEFRWDVPGLAFRMAKASERVSDAVKKGRGSE
ncbi:MAG: hypothetical protein IJ227_03290 [Mogibacterium sp.]|nr:hypothetical protein [Mogibacterium sp.]